MKTYNFDRDAVMALPIKMTLGGDPLTLAMSAQVRKIAFPEMPKPRDGYMTYFDPGWSVLKTMKFFALRDTLESFNLLQPNGVQMEIKYDSGYDELAKYEFAQQGGQPSYRQLLLGALPGSANLLPADQLALLPQGHRVALAREVLFAKLILWVETGDEYALFIDGKALRCGDVVDGKHVYVYDSVYPDETAQPEFGLSAMIL